MVLRHMPKQKTRVERGPGFKSCYILAGSEFAKKFGGYKP